MSSLSLQVCHLWHSKETIDHWKSLWYSDQLQLGSRVLVICAVMELQTQQQSPPCLVDVWYIYIYIDIIFLVGGLEHFFICPYIRNNTPYWLIFFRGVETTNQYILTWYYMNNMIYYVIVVHIMISMWYGGLKCVILWYCVIVQYFRVFRWYRKDHSLFCLAGSVAATRYAGNNLVMEQCLFIIWEYIGVCLLLPSLKEDAEYLIPYISGILPPLLGSFSTAMWIFQQCSLDFLCSAHIHTDKCIYRICAYRNESTLICNIYIYMHTYWGEHVYIYVQYDQINHQTIKGFSEVCVVQERRYQDRHSTYTWHLPYPHIQRWTYGQSSGDRSFFRETLRCEDMKKSFPEGSMITWQACAEMSKQSCSRASRHIPPGVWPRCLEPSGSQWLTD
jgi:hypothetical protein